MHDEPSILVDDGCGSSSSAWTAKDIRGLLHRSSVIQSENATLRAALSQVAANLNNGSSASRAASLDFLAAVPEEVRLCVQKLSDDRARLDWLESRKPRVSRETEEGVSYMKITVCLPIGKFVPTQPTLRGVLDMARL